MTAFMRAARACIVLVASFVGCAEDAPHASDEGMANDTDSQDSSRKDAGVVDSGGAQAPDAATDAGGTGARDARAPLAADAGKDAAAAPAASAQDASREDAAAPADDASRSDAGSSGELRDTVVEATIVVRAGQTFDGTGKRFVASAALGDGSQSEDQEPVFKLEPGAKLTNVVIGAPGVDGIHVHGDAVLENIVWEDIGEDALTIKESGTVELRGGSARDGDDKVFQINAASVFRVSDFKATNAGKFIRQNGGTTFKVEVYIDHCDISNMKEAIFRTDSDASTVSFTNSRYSQIGKSLFIGVAPNNIREQNNSAY